MPKLKNRPTKNPTDKRRRRKGINRLIENDLIREMSFDEYRHKINRAYSGPKGALLSTCSMLTLHIPLGERIFRKRKFDLRGLKSILDVGSGVGQIAQHLIKYSDSDAKLTCTDLSHQMLRRARHRLQGRSPDFVSADISNLPFADESFDCVTCGYVLEHLPDPQPGLAEVARVLRRGGKLFLLTTEDTFAGAVTSRFWHCRTYNRKELLGLCEKLRLHCKQEIWFTKMHKAIHVGGICVEIEKK